MNLHNLKAGDYRNTNGLTFVGVTQGDRTVLRDSETGAVLVHRSGDEWHPIENVDQLQRLKPQAVKAWRDGFDACPRDGQVQENEVQELKDLLPQQKWVNVALGDVLGNNSVQCEGVLTRTRVTVRPPGTEIPGTSGPNVDLVGAYDLTRAARRFDPLQGYQDFRLNPIQMARYQAVVNTGDLLRGESWAHA
ncbi:MAG TPA: hypothetical protein VGO93_16245 [Candidatus Xenobia bacterium]